MKIEDLIIEPKMLGQRCDTCPFMIDGVATCIYDAANHDIHMELKKQHNPDGLGLFCDDHTIKLKP
jgi:hypothetical protein